jgi:uncharacterized protein (DUF983 family)
MENPKPSDTADVPVRCPVCGSVDLAAADASSYSRCRACGEIWNAGRRQQTIPSRYDPPRRRY